MIVWLGGSVDISVNMSTDGVLASVLVHSKVSLKAIRTRGWRLKRDVEIGSVNTFKTGALHLATKIVWR